MIDIRIKVNDDKKAMKIEIETKKFLANENEERFYKFLVESINQYKECEEKGIDALIEQIENMLKKLED